MMLLKQLQHLVVGFPRCCHTKHPLRKHPSDSKFLRFQFHGSDSPAGNHLLFKIPSQVVVSHKSGAMKVIIGTKIQICLCRQETDAVTLVVPLADRSGSSDNLPCRVHRLRILVENVRTDDVINVHCVVLYGGGNRRERAITKPASIRSDQNERYIVYVERSCEIS